jgi:hypothetical protein
LRAINENPQAQRQQEGLNPMYARATQPAIRNSHAAWTDPLSDCAAIANLIEACLSEGLIAEPDQDRLRKHAADLRADRGTPQPTYIELISALQRGTTTDKALAVLGTLYQSDDVIELRALEPRGGTAFSVLGCLRDNGKQIADFIRRHNGSRNLYVGINPRRTGLAGAQFFATAEDIAVRRHVVLDFDNKDAPATDPQWLKTGRSLAALKPTMIVASGNGHHFWFSIDPVLGEEVAATSPLLARAMARVGADNMADPPRIIRLPFTINLPTKAKRENVVVPATLALARILQGPTVPARRRKLTDLAHGLRDIADSLNLPGKQTKGHESSVSSGATARPPEMLVAPDGELLRAALACLPNEEHMDRDFQVALAHAVKRSADGTPFADDAREAFLEWSLRFPGRSDPAHDEKLYDQIRNPQHLGWPDIKRWLHAHSPKGFAEIEAREAPFRQRAARAAFASAPISEPDLEERSGAAPAQESSEKKGAAMAAVGTLRGRGQAEFFHAPDGKFWISLVGRIHRIDETKGCREAIAWLARHGTIVTGNGKADLKDQMIGRALSGPTREVFYRQANGGDPAKPEAFLNLMNAAGDGVHLDATGWRVKPLSTLAIRMTDRARALALPRPVRANDGQTFISRLRQHVPLASVKRRDDPSDLGIQQDAALLMFACAQVCRSGAVPHLLISAAQGSGKTTAARRLKSLLDPDSVDVVTSLTQDEAALYAIAEQQTLLVIDNASSIKNPDLIAALATGAGHQRRELYSDGGRVVFRAKTSLVLTTVRDEITRRPDLRDRLLRLDLPPLERKDRKTEAELDRSWETDRPLLLADLLDLASGALGRLDAVRQMVDAGLLPSPPRLADAALFAEAAAQAAGWKPGLCLAGLNAMRDNDAAQQLEDNPVAFRVRALLDAEGGSWSGAVRNLMDRLRFVEAGPEWNRECVSVQAFTSALDRIAGPMRDIWQIETMRTRGGGARRLTLRRT